MAKKATKVTKDELKSIQEKVNSINNIQMQIGGLVIQQNQAVKMLESLQTELNVIQTSLESKYGKVSVNIQDGSLKEIPEQNGSLN
jgi:allophanate hydrolase subunit 1